MTNELPLGVQIAIPAIMVLFVLCLIVVVRSESRARRNARRAQGLPDDHVYSPNETVYITIRAPRREMKRALMWASISAQRATMESKGRRAVRPGDDNPFLVMYDGNEVDIEFIPKDEHDHLNESLTKCGYGR